MFAPANQTAFSLTLDGQPAEFKVLEFTGLQTISLVPYLFCLQHSAHQRIFQHQSVPQIVARVLEGQGIRRAAFKLELSSPCLEREYCVRFDQTDLAFIQRLEDQDYPGLFTDRPGGSGDEPTLDSRRWWSI